MRPIRLEMSAFGPYAGTEIVEFDRFGNRGIFVITGNTGAGKTTIFDGITYALYGEPSGDNREVRSFRSKYADIDTPTYVELKFECHGSIYVIRRNPDYMRPKTKGSGVTKEAASQTLTMPDGRIITRTAEVNEAVEDIIGVNKEQYKHIAMIAQGDFLKLLLASTDERMKIFRKIFNTSGYLKLQDRVKSDMLKLKYEYSDDEKSFNQYVSDIQCDEEDMLYSEVCKAREGSMPAGEVIELLKELIGNDSTRQEQFGDIRAQLEDELKALLDIVTVENTRNDARDKLVSAEKELYVIRESMGELDDRLKEARVRETQIRQLREEAARLETTYAEYDALDEQTLTVKKLDKRLESDKTRLEELAGRIEQKESNIEELVREREALKDAPAQVEKLKASVAEYNREREELKTLADEINNYFSLQDIYRQKQEAYVRVCAVHEQQYSNYERMNRAYLDGQAGILAEGLEDGTPCPVCGSISHPAKKSRDANVPSEAELNNAKAEADKAAADRENASVEAGQAKTACEASADVILRTASRMNMDRKYDNAQAINIIRDSVKAAFDEMEARSSRLKEECAVAGKNKERYTSLELLVPEETAALEQLKREEGELRTLIAAAGTERKTMSDNIARLRDKLVYDSRKTAEKQHDELVKAADTYSLAIETAEKDCVTAREKEAKLKGNIDSLRQVIGDEEPRDLEEIQTQVSELRTRINEADIKLKMLYARISRNEDIMKAASGCIDELAVKAERLRWMSALSATANGEVRGREKIELETYVQMEAFDRIISKANLRLMIMSSNQYELKRRVEADNSRSKFGLDLNVIDHYDNSERPVNTLSGGESFVASLALALGMSDMIQQAAGGVRIDSMFIDEGFGTLDDEILEQTMRALAGLSEYNRLVGIISHREELKARIDRQVVVTKGVSGGSHVKLIV